MAMNCTLLTTRSLTDLRPRRMGSDESFSCLSLHSNGRPTATGHGLVSCSRLHYDTSRAYFQA